MKSIQSKFLVLVLGRVLLAVVVIGGSGIWNAKITIDRDSAQNMNLICDEKAQELNGQLSRIEQSVKTLAVYALDKIGDAESAFESEESIEALTRELESIVVNLASNTEGAVTVYVRYNPAWTPPTSGLFLQQNRRQRRFQKQTPTDFSSYSSNDLEHVGWYYIPVEREADVDGAVL